MLIDITRLIDRFLQGRIPTGVDRVSLAYLEHFGAHAHALIRFGGRWIEFCRQDSERMFAGLLGHAPVSCIQLRYMVARAYASAWGRRSAQLLFNTGHSGLDQLGYPEKLRQRGLLPLFFLHDLIPITHPEYCRQGEAVRHQRRMEAMLRLGAGLMVNSRSTLDALHGYAACYGYTLPPCVVAPLAPGRLPMPSRESLLEQPYFVMLGTIEPRKNHLLLLHVWRELALELGSACPRLVLIGQRGWECEQVVDLLERCPALKSVIIEKTSCPDQELATWLAHARALLFPSFAEGFGMPLVEALMLKVPVIASRLEVFHEIAGDIPEYLHPLDGLGWKTMVLDYLHASSPARQAQLMRMEGYRPPDWQTHFQIVEALIEQVHAAASR